jgi:hypothetical protein
MLRGAALFVLVHPWVLFALLLPRSLEITHEKKTLSTLDLPLFSSSGIVCLPHSVPKVSPHSSLFVSASGGDDTTGFSNIFAFGFSKSLETGDGSEDLPFASVGRALKEIGRLEKGFILFGLRKTNRDNLNPSNEVTIIVKSGNYIDSPNLDLFLDFNCSLRIIGDDETEPPVFLVQGNILNSLLLFSIFFFRPQQESFSNPEPTFNFCPHREHSLRRAVKP